MKTHTVQILAGMGFVLFVALIAYTMSNSSAHTGMDPVWLYMYFIPLGIVGLASISMKWVSFKLSLVAIIVAILGVGSLLYLDKTNTLLSYDKWIERGMPDKGEH